MPRYFFDVHDGVSSPDGEGTELAGCAAARTSAIELAGALLKDSSSDWDGDAWRMEVRIDGGSVLFSLHFSVEEAA